MKICVAQTRPVTGNIEANINNHKKMIELAASYFADTIIFPELSLTGYEPALAESLATDQEDTQFNDFQQLSSTKNIAIGVGVPTRGNTKPYISMIIFQPNQERQTYSKKYLHADEEPFFSSGKNVTCLQANNINIALAICYELSVNEHAANAFKAGAKMYIASVAKFANGIHKALDRLAHIASQYSMMVLMSNCIGPADGQECAGTTSIWNSKGLLLAQLDDKQEGILIIDTETQEITPLYFKVGG